ncbi:uncharacterized protein [Rutidosis leptorrhynchoides]|uniref:uncharacterized protein n=1 Tax=Rutidosis leptorrhynchoides TaxID=125765 RepID=UPI003A9A0B7E
MGNSSKKTTEAQKDDYVDNEDFDIDQFDSDIGDEDEPAFMRGKKKANSDTWVVKTYRDEHDCLESRVIRQCTSKLLSKHLLDQLQTNPDIPVKAVKAQLEKNLEVKLHPHKAFRALQKARQLIKGNYIDQYGELRDYILELRRSNPSSTVKLEVEDCNTPSSVTGVFKRIYIYLSPLKRGFNAIGRDLLGVDGAFMKEPTSVFLLTVVALYSNNGIYPLAYEIAKSECYSSWLWFLELLARDLDLTKMSNFTFISDRQKGLIIAAVGKVFPVAENRFCLRHIQQNMKKYWHGDAIKNHLWACASATTMPQLERKMAEFQEFSEPAHLYLSKIQPAQWARSHFTGRAHSDILLNNHCEVLNRWLCDARDKPIITALEYIITYMIKWELTGMPCKHVVAAMLNMDVYSQDEKTYSHTINPVKGKSEWVKSPIPTNLVCPKKLATTGHPKKNMRKSLEEKDDMVANGKLSKKGKSIKCSRCVRCVEVYTK